MDNERPLVFTCHGDRLIGLLHPGAKDAVTGVIIVVGGPQYRVGSHRQFVLIGRQLASAGFPVLRFDYRGMGDAEGEPRDFEQIEDDIDAAIDCLYAELPNLQKVVLFGLCDAASASLMYAPKDERVAGLILLNPWVRTPESEAKSYLRHYYLRRVLQKSFWRKVLGGSFAFRNSMKSLLTSIKLALWHGRGSFESGCETTFIDSMLLALESFRHPVLLLISGRDLTAKEFVHLCRTDHSWKTAVNRAAVTTVECAEADHTFSNNEELVGSTNVMMNWLEQLRDPIRANV